MTFRIQRLALPAVGFLVVAAIALPVPAKCPMVQYRLKGTVKDGVTQRPVGGATIFVFLDDAVETMPGGGASQLPDSFSTDAKGEFVATSWADSLSGEVAGKDDCQRVVTRAEIIVLRNGFFSRRVVVSGASLDLRKVSDGYEATLPPILLRKPAGR